ncbi:hypothetical protein ABGO37_003184 [Escherichia coli]|uniref:hypothetical protein n=1 Tax=Escherichia coli TaxID=562 RepID=UPI0015EAB514|nr:hypothetical protein [Escherichia coli]EET9802026.1 hypothetical protein [Escherichia coli]EFH3606560.1 hypothetical protein [Escherichia coli]EGD7795821.1 hypothetical protein [Escherichia coli]EGM8565176.1 hypothetical protein [Escherichia coli]EGO7536118.1 hypothetical protein [Escherichia coli]
MTGSTTGTATALCLITADHHTGRNPEHGGEKIPAVEKGKKYEIRVEVREVTPPPAPDMDAPNP